jgi:rod shape-determining protein MreD
VWAASFLAAYVLIDRQRDMLASLSGIGAIVGFSVTALVACGSAYVIVGVYYWQLPPSIPVVAEFAMTVLFYPLVAFLLGVVHRRLVGPLRTDF